MPPESPASIALDDLKLLPAWVKESPDAKQYAHYEGDDGRDERSRGRDRRPPRRDGDRRPDGDKRRTPGNRPPGSERRGPPGQQGRDRRGPQGKRDQNRGRRPDDRNRQDRPVAAPKPPPEIAVRFIPQTNAFDSIAAQIKADALAYSVFSLARLFLQKPERYDVHLASAKPESPMFQLGENGAVSSDRPSLESNAFRTAQKDFYKVDITQSDPIKGNFTSVARDRLSGTLLGPTNHHAYQPRLRTLYEQRFSRRMSFPDYQRQIEIVSDPALVEQWKEEARTVTTFTTLNDDPPSTFNNANEAEKHFRQKHLPDFVRTVPETIIDGVTSRNLGDRALRGLIEDAWSAQTRSPSQMMQELATRLRDNGLHIFRHRKGMLFVSPIRVRPFGHEETSISAQVKGIFDAVVANPRINRKDLAEKLLTDVPAEESEARKMALASDLKWLISEGYVIEFNDGSLDLPRVKPKKEEDTRSDTSSAEGGVPTTGQAAATESSVVAAVPAAVDEKRNESPTVGAAVPAAEQKAASPEKVGAIDPIAREEKPTPVGSGEPSLPEEAEPKVAAAIESKKSEQPAVDTDTEIGGS